MSQEEQPNIPIRQDTGIMKVKSTADVREILQTYTREKQYTSLLYKGNTDQQKLLKPNAAPSLSVLKRPLETTSSERNTTEGVRWMKHQNKNPTVSEPPPKLCCSVVTTPEKVEDLKITPSIKEENPATENIPQDVSNDSYCWICHKEGNVLCCEVCPRVFHLRCLGEREEPPGDWVCPECQAIEKAENVDTRSPSMAMLNMEELYRLLKFSIHKMKQHANSCLKMAATQPPLHLFTKNDRKLSPDAFLRPVCTKQFPSYPHYVFHPMDLSTLEKNIQLKMYGCTESFLADVKWILHNCIIFNGYQHQLTNNAKSLVKLCKYEMEEIETCPDCYLHSCMHKEHWFCEPCRKPHIVVWAKLKGFPFWPAKVMRIVDGNIDVRFFGAHDRAWVPVNQCYLLSKEMPTPMKCKKKGSFELSLEEITIYANRVKEIFGTFQYAPVRTPFDPDNPPLYSTLSHPKLHDLTYSPSSSSVASPQPPILNIPVTPPVTKKPKYKEGRYGKPQDTKKKEETTFSLSTPSWTSSSWERDVKPTHTPPPQHLIPKVASVRKRAPPVGIFEVSDESTIKMPALLEINFPKLNLKKPIKTSGKIVEKLESKIQQITESNSGNSDDEVVDKLKTSEVSLPSPPKEQVVSTKEDCTDSVLSTDDTMKGRMSPLSESIQSSLFNTLSESDSDDRPLSELCQSTTKKDDVFSQKLNRIIESCKAKLGIKEVKVDDIETIESDEDYVPPTNEDDSGAESGHEIDSQKKHLEENRSDVHQSHESKMIDADSAKLGNSKETKTESQKGDNTDDSDSWLSDDSQPLAVIIKKAKMTKPAEQTQEPQKISEIQIEDISNESLEPSLETSSSLLVSSKEANTSTIDMNGDNSESLQAFCTDTTEEKGIENHITQASASPPPEESSLSQSHDDIASAEDDIIVDEDSNMANSDVQKYSSKMLDAVYDNQEETTTMSSMRDVESLKSTIKNLQLEIEKLQWYHQQELIEMKHNSDLVLLEMRASMESDKQRAIRELQQQHKTDKQKAIDETKKKQWCANCGAEASFYCCWNTNYCNHTCQQDHWPKHLPNCGQTKGMVADPSQSPSKLCQVKEETTQQPVPVTLASSAKVIPSQQLGPILHHSGSSSKSTSLLLPSQQFPQVQYIPSNAVQVLPQNTSILGNTGQPVQIQYIATNLSSVPRNPHPAPSFINVGSASISLTSQSTASPLSSTSKQSGGET